MPAPIWMALRKRGVIFKICFKKRGVLRKGRGVPSEKGDVPSLEETMTIILLIICCHYHYWLSVLLINLYYSCLQAVLLSLKLFTSKLLNYKTFYSLLFLFRMFQGRQWKKNLSYLYYLTKFDGIKWSGFWIIPKIISSNLCKPMHDIINYSTSICPFESRKSGREEEKIPKFEYLENKKSFWNEIKNIFHSFWRAIIWWKNKNLIKNSGRKL